MQTTSTKRQGGVKLEKITPTSSIAWSLAAAQRTVSWKTSVQYGRGQRAGKEHGAGCYAAFKCSSKAQSSDVVNMSCQHFKLVLVNMATKTTVMEKHKSFPKKMIFSQKTKRGGLKPKTRRTNVSIILWVLCIFNIQLFFLGMRSLLYLYRKQLWKLTTSFQRVFIS